jgi:hypothetical protein
MADCVNDIKTFPISQPVPWPSVIMTIFGVILILYTGFAPIPDPNRRPFGLILLILWTLMWILILWVFWRDEHYTASWSLLCIASILMFLFFILALALKFG